MAVERSPDGTVVWIEIPATGDADELKSFYKGVFPKWEFHDPYPMMRSETRMAYRLTSGKETHVSGYQTPKGLGGGIVKMPQGCDPDVQQMGRGFTNYYTVSSLHETEKKVIELGGKTCLPKTKQGDSGYFMNFLDPQGNRFGVYEFVG